MSSYGYFFMIPEKLNLEFELCMNTIIKLMKKRTPKWFKWDNLDNFDIFGSPNVINNNYKTKITVMEEDFLNIYYFISSYDTKIFSTSKSNEPDQMPK